MNTKQAVVRESGLLVAFKYQIEGDNIIILNNKVRINDRVESIIKVFQVNPAQGESREKHRFISLRLDNNRSIYMAYYFTIKEFIIHSYDLKII